MRFVEQRLYPPPDAIVLGMRFSDLIWWLEPLGAGDRSASLWGGLLAEFIEHARRREIAQAAWPPP